MGGSKKLVLAAGCLGFFVAILRATSVNTALPAIRVDLGGGLSGLQWVLNGYTLVFASLLLAAGALSDKLGARRVLLLGLGVFAVASGLSSVAPTLSALVAFQALLGVGGALVVPATLAVIVAAFPEPAERARAGRAVVNRAELGSPGSSLRAVRARGNPWKNDSCV